HGRAKSLLMLLLSQPSATLIRDKAAASLWPHANATAGRRHLSNAIWNLRQALGASGRSLDHVFQADTTTLCLHLTSERDAASPGCWIDALAFEAACRQMRRTSSDREQLAAGSTALKLYSGDFLPAGPDADWSHARRARLREQWIQAAIS